VGTIFHSEYGEQGVYRTDSAQIPAESENRKMKFPVVIRHRSEKAKIYGKTPAYPFYRLAYKAAGQRHVRSFKTYSEARREGDHVVRDLAQGSQAAALTTGQAANALTALELLQGFRQQTGHNISLERAVADYVEAARQLNGRPWRKPSRGVCPPLPPSNAKASQEPSRNFARRGNQRPWRGQASVRR
jgi:hypothetical protein